MAHAIVMANPGHVAPRVNDPISEHGSVRVILAANMRAVKQLLHGSQFWQTVPEVVEPASIPASMWDVSGIIWGMDDGYEPVTVVSYAESSVDDVW